MKKWVTKKDSEGRAYHYRSGFMAGPEYQSRACVVIEEMEHVNGSGWEHFGGAERWPNLTIGISFPVGTDLAPLIPLIQEFIDKVKPE